MRLYQRSWRCKCCGATWTMLASWQGLVGPIAGWCARCNARWCAAPFIDGEYQPCGEGRGKRKGPSELGPRT